MFWQDLAAWVWLQQYIKFLSNTPEVTFYVILYQELPQFPQLWNK